jgi:hypothetical protein
MDETMITKLTTGHKIILTTLLAALIFLGASALLLVKYANRIIKVELEARLGGPSQSTESILSGGTSK